MKSFNFINQKIRCVSGVNLNLSRYAAMVLVLLLGVGNAWAGGGGSSTYKTDFKATADGTGKGYVYASDKQSPSSIEYVATSDNISESSDLGGSDKTTKYYAWAKAVRGNEFKNWSISGSNNGVSPTSSTDNPVTVTVTSNKENSTNTGTAKANWTSYTKVNVTYNPSEDGAYSVSYQYDSYNSSSKTITTGDAENLSRTITAAGGAQTIGSYYNDVITLTSTSGTFEGWYSDAGFNTPLSGSYKNSTYTFVAPQSGTASVYAKYAHKDKYYGRLTASIADVPYSMPGGGMIFVSEDAGAAVAYSDASQTVDNVGFGETSQKFYLYAKPNDKRYVFRGWYNNPECAGDALSTNAEYTYTLTATSTSYTSPTTGAVYAAFDFNLYYMQVEVEPAIPSQGMVLASDTKLTTLPDYTGYSSTSSVFAYAYRLAPTADVYVYAMPKYGYKFGGWYTDPECTEAASVASDGKYTATGSSTDFSDPTITKLYAKFIEESKINVTYNNPDHSKGEYKAYGLDIAEENDEYIWSRLEIFSSVGKTDATVQSQYKTDVLILEAEPKSNLGYGVTKWYDGGDKTSVSRIYTTSATSNKTVGVTFGDAKPFYVSKNGISYSDFQEAINHAEGSGSIKVLQDAYIPAGNYNLSGVALYVPRANGTSAKGTSVERSSAAVTAPTPYVTLTLAKGANITTNNAIEVGAQIVGKAQDNSSAAAGCNGAISGTYGRIVMNEGSTITLNGSSAKLYAWGQIVGSGRITANSGSTVYEIFQVTDWCGGSRAYACNDGKSTYHMFPFSQYHIQNIEVPLRVKNGASEKLMAVIDGNAADDIPLIGANNSTSMFRMNSSDAYIEKSYDKVNDRQVFRVNGTSSISDFSLKVVITISTTSFHLPLTNNMTIYIESGTTTLNTNAIVNADAKIIINEGATAELASGKSLYVYDSDDWLSGFVFNGKKIAPIRYSLPYATTDGTSSGTPIRTNAKIQDASILVNGTLKMNGLMYTSSGNANIYSTATGVIKFGTSAASGSTTVYHLNTISGSNILASVATTYNTTMYPAKLRNEDGTFVATEGAVKDDQFIYSKDMGKWMKNPKVITWNANGGEVEPGSTAHSQDAFLGELPVATKDGYDLVGWFTAADGGTQISQTTKVTATTTYYAHWTPKTYTITYKNQGESTFAGSEHIDTPNPHPTTHTFNAATTLNGATRKHYTFGGWYKTVSCTGTVVTEIPASTSKNITLYAKWTEKDYTITYLDKDGAPFSGVQGAGAPMKHTYGAATALVDPSKEGYTFLGWYTSEDCSTEPVTSLGATAYTADITLYAKWKQNKVTVTWDANGGAAAEPATTEVNPGKAVGELAETSKEGYTYKWYTAPTDGEEVTTATTVSEDKTFYALFTEITHTVTLAYKCGNTSLQDNGSVTGVGIATTKNATAPAIAGYTFANWTLVTGVTSATALTNATISINATADSKTITANYTLNSHKFAWNFNGGTPSGSYTQANNAMAYGSEITYPSSISKQGYTFAGWSSDVTSMPDEDLTITANWNANTNTPYTVEHYQQNIDGTYPSTPTETENLAGTTDASVTPERKNYAGFTAPAGQTVTILADGSLVVEYKYTRNSPNLSWSSNGGNALTGSYTIGSVKYGASITAPNDPTRTGYSFSGWSPAFTGTMPATDTEYKAQWTPEKRKVTWKDGTTTIKTEDLDYDSKPSYAYVKTPTAQYSFPLLKWEDEDTRVQYDPDNLPVVKNNVTYVAICGNVVNEYTVRFVNDQGTELQVISNIPYGDWPEYTGETPSSEIINDYYIREFKGWNPEIAEVGGHTTYTARYEIVAKLDIKEEYVVPTTTIVETTTVEVGGSLNVANEKKLTTTDLIIEGSADEDWEEITSGEVVAVESAIEADNAYYDMRPEGGYKARIWYAVAVPWTVDVPTGVPGHVYDANGHALRLNIDFDLLYYDGAQRAAGGTNNWRYVAQEEAENQVMKPGRAYMIYLANPTSKLRFEKSSGNWLTKELPLEYYPLSTGDDTDANWNGIANPAIYRAYLNAGTDGNWGQVFVPGSAPRDGGTYVPFDMQNNKLAVGQPIFVQAENTEKETVIAYRSNDDYLSHAPRRAQADAAEQEARYAVEIAVNGKRGDRIFIATNDDKEDAYTIGSDVVKMGWSSTKPQMWINRYGSKLCVNTVEFNGSSATYPLMIQIPSEGEYSIYTPSEILSGHELYITYNGRAIWNLSYAPFEGTFAAGTHAEYGLKLVRSKLPTDIEQTNAGQEDVRKVLIDDHVYIIRGGAVFSIDGQLVK